MKRPWQAAISHHDPVVPSMPEVAKASRSQRMGVLTGLPKPFRFAASPCERDSSNEA